MIASALLLLSLLLAFRSRQDTFDRIQVREFELVDEKGVKRASISTEVSGEVVFRLMDKNGTIRVKLGAAEDGSGLLLLDENTEPAVHALAKNKGSTLTLVDPDGNKKQY